MKGFLKFFKPRWGAVVLALLCLNTTMPAQTIKRITQAQAVGAAIEKPAPGYSTVARQLRLEGTVAVNAYISDDGTVDRVEGVSGNPVLLKAAADALKHWKFRPIQQDGRAVKAVAELSFNFKL